MKKIGDNIKSQCEKKNISIEDLAIKSGVTYGSLMMIIDGRTTPSLSNLLRICRALEISVEILVDGTEEEAISLTRQEDRKVFVTYSGNTGVDTNLDYYSLAPNKSNRSMEPVYVEVNSEDNHKTVPSSHEGEEFIYVIDGEVSLEYGDQQWDLNSGDSVYYDSLVPHKFISKKGKSKILAVTYRPW